MNSSNRSQVLSDVKGELSGRSEPPTISIPNETDSRLSAMTMEVWKLEKALTCMRAEKDAELKEATEMLKSSENTVQALRLLDDSARHRQTLDEKRRRTDALQLSQSAKTIGDLQKEVARSKEKYTLLEKERQEEETQFSDEREALRAEIQRKEKEHQDLEERMVMAQDCMKDLVEKVNDSEELGREKQRTLNADRDAFESAITSQRSDFEVTIADLEALVRDATKRNDCLTRERDRQIQVSAQQQAEINRIKQEAEENTGQLREYEKRIAAYKTRIDGLIAEAEARWKNRSQVP
ncbi:hypothetical protein C8J56DRAFT_398528 [Mycena floridula]|nr:hypothetical protein C8J56DRAFT_398528 [Mycena floridula]